ncbi:MAG: hypothetical protein V2I39_09975 [Erythrobacter sp.]|nr:hypothetical protein [Erythrobacter sp.]
MALQRGNRPSSSTLLAASLALAACESETGGRPPGVSEGEAKALEEAAEMLEAERLPDGVLPETEPPAGETEPEPAA